MEATTTTSKMLDNTAFKHRCNIYKENTIPILKDYNISDQCKEIGKQLLNMTKNPLCQHVDVLIPKLDRNDSAKLQQMEHFKSFFGTKHVEQQHIITTESNSFMQEKLNINNNNKIKSKNAYISNTPATKFIMEFINTEETYVRLLEEVAAKIMKPIRESIINPNKTPILDQYSFNRIFINLEDILQVNQSFLTALKQYENGSTTDSFGQILSRHIETFDCYKIFLLGKPNSLSCHSQNLKQNKNYAKFLLNKTLEKNFGMSDVLISPVQRMGRYDLMIKNVLGVIDSNETDTDYLKEGASKVSSINDMRYGSDSSLLNLYHLIREAPASLIQTRKLLGYFDASELSLLTGKTHRPVTILVFTDKIMVVKRKNYNLQSKEYLENIEEKIKIGSTNIIQKAKEVYNGLPLEFKGWADIQSVELFHGLKDRPDTFFLRTCLPELNPNATEKECESYFRRSDRLYSIIPNTSTRNLSSYISRKQELMNLCQKQLALQRQKKVETSQLYHEDKFKLPAYTHIYDQNSYKQAEFKNNILIIYVEENYPEMDLNALLTDQVWIVILLTHHESGGYKPAIRARTSLIPIREISREMEYESIVNTVQQKDPNAPLDFIDTLWNNLFFYERRLRATEAYSCIKDDLLRDRARSRSRSKSLTRVASNMSIGKLFARSRSSSPSRRRSSASSNERTDDDDDQTSTEKSHVSDPIFKVASVNKHTGNEFRDYSPPLSHNTNTTINTPSRMNTQPQFRYPPNEIFIRDDHTFIDSIQDGSRQQEEVLYAASNHHQDNSYYRGSLGTNNSFDVMLLQSSSPEFLSRPSSGGSSSASSEADRLYRGLNAGDSLSSNTSSGVRSYFDENNFFASPRATYGRSKNNHNSASYDERLMSTIDGSARSSSSSRRAPLHPNFYSHPHQQQPTLPHRSQTMPDVVSTDFSQLKDDVNGLIDDLIQSQQQLRSQQDIGRYYNSTYESVQGLRTHIVSKIDNLMENLHHNHQYQLR